MTAQSLTLQRRSRVPIRRAATALILLLPLAMHGTVPCLSLCLLCWKSSSNTVQETLKRPRRITEVLVIGMGEV